MYIGILKHQYPCLKASSGHLYISAHLDGFYWISPKQHFTSGEGEVRAWVSWHAVCPAMKCLSEQSYGLCQHEFVAYRSELKRMERRGTVLVRTNDLVTALL